jgi:ABC-type molybdate transport system substrate-binding protein
VSVRAVAAVIVLALVSWFGVRYVVHRAGAGDCGSGTITLRVAAAPDIAPVLASVAGSLAGAQRHAGQYCYTAQVSVADPAKTATALSGKVSDTQPDVWVPDSSYWLSRLAGGQDAPVRSASVASSPVVIALADPVARKLGWPDRAIGWRQLLATGGGAPGPQLGMPDPAGSPVGVSALLAVSAVTVKDGRPTAATVAAMRSLAANVSTVASDLYGKLPQSADAATVARSLGGFPATEQSVAAYDAQHPAVTAVPVYPEPASPSLDYPYLVTAGRSGQTSAAAQRFLSILQSPEASQALTRAGFRTASGSTGAGFPAGSGLRPGIVAPVPLPAAKAVAQTVGVWATLTLPSRLLALIDVSGSMSELVPGTNLSRMQVTISASLQSLGLYADNSAIGLWTFSTHLDGDKDYRQVVPIAPLAANRAALAAAIGKLRVKQGGATGLYDSVLAAYKELTANWDPARSNAITVFTDGENEDDNGISRATLLSELGKLYDPAKPVRIIFLGLGPDVNADELAQIAKVTHGQSFVSRDPGKIGEIFLEAVSARVCQAASC